MLYKLLGFQLYFDPQHSFLLHTTPPKSPNGSFFRNLIYAVLGRRATPNQPLSTSLRLMMRA